MITHVPYMYVCIFLIKFNLKMDYLLHSDVIQLPKRLKFKFLYLGCVPNGEYEILPLFMLNLKVRILLRS